MRLGLKNNFGLTKRWVKKGNVWCLGYNGIDNYVDCGNNESLNIADAITIETLIRVSVIEDVFKTIVANSPAAYEYNYWLYQRNNRIGFVIWNNNSNTSIFSDNVITEIDNWYQIIVTAQKNSTVKIYINGIEEGSGIAGNMIWPTIEVKIGTLREPPICSFNGIIDEVRIYNRVIDQNEIEYNSYNGNVTKALLSPRIKNKSGLVGHWKFEEGKWDENNFTRDWSGNKNHGVGMPLGNPPVWTKIKDTL